MEQFVEMMRQKTTEMINKVKECKANIAAKLAELKDMAVAKYAELYLIGAEKSQVLNLFNCIMKWLNILIHFT